MSFTHVYDELLAVYGPQKWWPGEDEFEVIVGAMLVQRTNWRNVETALSNLSHKGLLTPGAMAKAELETIERSIRSAGFFRSKAFRLRQVAEFLAHDTSLRQLKEMADEDLRQTLLALDGVGPETADSILLYAFGRPVVVVDEYLRRLVRRLTAQPEARTDQELRQLVLEGISKTEQLNEFHALVVAHGKQTCGSEPVCGKCVLKPSCRTGISHSDS